MAASKQLKEAYKAFSRHGVGDALVEISPKDVVVLIHIAYADVVGDEAEWIIEEYQRIAETDFFQIAPDMIDELPVITQDEAIGLLVKCGATDTSNIIYLYLKNLCDLYRRRFKYLNILRAQPFPTVDQIGPRCLLEFGNCSNDLLFNWMNWRKWIYDIDNRSAQETGYLFEPILSCCLGGEPVSHRRSMVRRLDADGNPTQEGRQIDCYIEETQEAYELKLRVTIAASGQGRFKEEMSFPREAEHAGLIPVLIVFDPTPSALLDKLKAEYVRCGGRYSLGEDAWNELISKAGKEMGTFIQKYIKPPISKMEEREDVLPTTITIEAKPAYVCIRDENGNEYKISRQFLSE